MRHARADALDALEPLLRRLRALDSIRERTRGVFYRGSKPFLHFHEDPAGLFADARLGNAWYRFPARTAAHRGALVKAVVAHLKAPRPRPRVPRGVRKLTE
jgi:hypothetical protein